MGWDLRELIARYGVPGAQVAVLAGGEIRDEAAGVVSLHTRVEATTDSVFKIGSVTKIWTATLVQQLVNDGLLELDRPVRDYLPGFRLSDPAATEVLNARHLLTHTGGIDGNHFTDTGRNDDAIEKFVAVLAGADHLLPPGTLFSYSNSGYVVLGRLVRDPQVEAVPDFGGGVLGWGLGWMLYRDGVVGHTGVSRGQKAFLRVVPSAGVAVAVLANSSGAGPMAYEILSTVLGNLAGVQTDSLPVPPADPPAVDADRMCGTYRSTLYDSTLTVEDGRAFLVRRPRSERARSFLGKPEDRVEVVRLHDSAVITARPTFGGHQVLSLIGSDEHGRAQFLHDGAAACRVS